MIKLLTILKVISSTASTMGVSITENHSTMKYFINGVFQVNDKFLGKRIPDESSASYEVVNEDYENIETINDIKSTFTEVKNCHGIYHCIFKNIILNLEPNSKSHGFLTTNLYKSNSSIYKILLVEDSELSNVEEEFLIRKIIYDNFIKPLENNDTKFIENLQVTIDSLSDPKKEYSYFFNEDNLQMSDVKVENLRNNIIEIFTLIQITRNIVGEGKVINKSIRDFLISQVINTLNKQVYYQSSVSNKTDSSTTQPIYPNIYKTITMKVEILQDMINLVNKISKCDKQWEYTQLLWGIWDCEKFERPITEINKSDVGTQSFSEENNKRSFEVLEEGSEHLKKRKLF